MTEGQGIVETLTNDFSVYDHEQADTGVVVHAERGYGKIIIRTIDSDTIVIMLYHLPFKIVTQTSNWLFHLELENHFKYWTWKIFLAD